MSTPAEISSSVVLRNVVSFPLEGFLDPDPHLAKVCQVISLSLSLFRDTSCVCVFVWEHVCVCACEHIFGVATNHGKFKV